MYLYNGKENHEELGLNWLSYGFRMYDPAIARFPSVDPIADQFAFVSPFNYAENDPVRYIDLWGLQKATADNKETYNSDKEEFNSYPEPEKSTTRSRMLSDLWNGYEVKTAEATNLTELLNESAKGTDIVYLKGDALELISNDPGLGRLEADIKSLFSNHDKFGKEELFESGQSLVGFGGDRGDFLNPDDLSQNIDVATNPLTWMLRNAQVNWWAESDKQGNINIEFHVFDVLDLSPSSSRSAGYNIYSIITGTAYHGLVNGNMNLQTRAELKKE